DELFGFRSIDAKVLRKAERRQAVHNPEVDDLGLAAMICGDHEWRHAEELRGRERVNVVAAAVGLDQKWIVGVRAEQTQLGLRIVGREQNVSRNGNEWCANVAAEFSANNNVLQIGIRG